MQLAGNTFLITGGSSGLGAACTRTFAAAGANVLIADRNPPDEADTSERVRFVRADVTSEAEVQAAVDAAQSAFGALHGAINCAGIGVAERVVRSRGPHALESFTRVIGVNLIGTFNVIRLAAAAISAGTPQPGTSGERGVIINTASVAAFDGQIGQAAYSASKGGVVGMTLPIARELAR